MILVYDIEIINSPVRDESRPNYKYADGWKDYKGMGISCVGHYNYDNGVTDCFNWDQSDQNKKEIFVEKFLSADLIIGFNNHRFDNEVMKEFGINIPVDKSYDVLENFYSAIGLSGSWDVSTHSGYSLGAMTKVLGHEGKSGNGKDAPFDWQDGKHEEIMEYCKHDVYLTKLLVDHIFTYGGLINPKTKKLVKMAIPYF